MFFNQDESSMKKLFLGFGLVLLTSGCSLDVGDESPTGFNISMGDTTGCLNNTSETLEQYFNGEASKKQITRTFDCMAHSLAVFEKHIVGKNQDLYTADELKDFLEKSQLIGKNELSMGFLAEAMELKRAFFGGSSVHLSRSDLDRARKLITVFKYELIRLHPIMPLTTEHFNKMSVKELDEATRLMKATGNSLGRAVRFSADRYEFESLKRFLHEMKVFQNADDSESGFSQVEENFPLLGAVKAVTVAPPTDEILPSDWQYLMTSVARWGGVYFKIQHFLANKGEASLIEGDHLKRLTLLVWEVKNLLDDAFKRQPDRMIPFYLLEDLVDALDESSLVNLPVKPTAIKHAMVPFFQKMLGGDDEGERGRQAKGWTIEATQRIWSHFKYWVEGQHYIEQAFLNTYGASEFKKGTLKEQDLVEFTPTSKVFKDPRFQKEAIETVQELAEHFLPMFEHQFGEMTVRPELKEKKHTYTSLTHLQWMSIGAGLFIQGYSDSPFHRASSTVDLKALKTFYEKDFWAVGYDMRVFDPRAKETAANSRFSEADMFTFHGNGDGRADYRELVELVSFMLSGSGLSRKMYDEILPLCPVSPIRDVRGELRISAPCFHEKFFLRSQAPLEAPYYTQLFHVIPGMEKFIGTLNFKKKRQFIEQLENAARWGGYDSSADSFLETGDLESFGVILHYIDTVFIRFDRDRDGRLNTREADRAFPVFEQKLKEVTPFKDDTPSDRKNRREVFRYMLSKGKPPGTFRWIWWRYFNSSDFNSDRGRLMSVFAAVASGDESSSD